MLGKQCSFQKHVWGPCVSDMTLKVDNYVMPIIRQPNFNELTWNVEMEKIQLIVGNEKWENKNNHNALKNVNLKEYLSNFNKYCSQSITKPINLISNSKKQQVIVISMQSYLCYIVSNEITNEIKNETHKQKF